MKEYPIIFNAPMVRALLEGRKTQTRRLAYTKNGKPSIWQKVKPGDKLWVRETWCPVDDREHGGELWVDYRATPKYAESHPAGWENEPDSPQALKWKPAIHMPRQASRITLEVTDVWTERLQEITGYDVLAEGAWPLPGGMCGEAHQAIQAFSALWDSLHGKGAWESNPQIMVISFSVNVRES